MTPRLAALLLFAVGCAALPDDGALLCNPNPARACPDGFECAADGRCYRIGHAPGDLGALGSDMGPVSCATSASCSTAAPICAQQSCTSCAPEGMSSECATYHPTTPLCGPTGGCVQCFTKDQCESTHQTCDLTAYACASCKTHADCSSGYCNVGTGVCADKSTQYYVDNATTAGCTDTGPGSFAVPFCTIQKGLNTSALNGSKPVIVFAGTYAEAVLVVPARIGNVDFISTMVGIGRPVLKAIGAGSSLSVAGAGTLKATLSVDGFVFDGSGISDGSAAVAITGANGSYSLTTLTLTHSSIRNGQGLGLRAQSNCTLLADSLDVYGNGGGGLQLDTTDFTITNALVRGNGSATATLAGVSIISAGETGKTTLANASIVSNMTSSSSAIESGMGCLAPVAVINTVIVGNTGGPGEVGATCAIQMTSGAYVGAPAGSENLPPTCMLTDLFVNPGNADYHPKKGGAPPCTIVDQGSSNGAPDHDFDGVARPQGALDDIGAFEAK